MGMALPLRIRVLSDSRYSGESKNDRKNSFISRVALFVPLGFPALGGLRVHVVLERAIKNAPLVHPLFSREYQGLLGGPRHNPSRHGLTSHEPVRQHIDTFFDRFAVVLP